MLLFKQQLSGQGRHPAFTRPISVSEKYHIDEFLGFLCIQYPNLDTRESGNSEAGKLFSLTKGQEKSNLDKWKNFNNKYSAAAKHTGGKKQTQNMSPHHALWENPSGRPRIPSWRGCEEVPQPICQSAVKGG